MLTAVVTTGTQLRVTLISSATTGTDEHEGDTEGSDEEEHSEENSGDHAEEGETACEFPEEDSDGNIVTDEAGHPICSDGPSPILPENKEMAWAAGSFAILFVAMVAFLVPKVRSGMKARYDHIADEHERADSMRAAAKADVAQYDSSLATVRAEARERVDAARQQLESERAAKLAEVNEAIAARRDAANAEALAARHAVEQQVADAVTDVTSRTLELAIGKSPDAGAVRSAVDAEMSTGVSS